MTSVTRVFANQEVPEDAIVNSTQPAAHKNWLHFCDHHLFSVKKQPPSKLFTRLYYFLAWKHFFFLEILAKTKRKWNDEGILCGGSLFNAFHFKGMLESIIMGDFRTHFNGFRGEPFMLFWRKKVGKTFILLAMFSPCIGKSLAIQLTQRHFDERESI